MAIIAITPSTMDAGSGQMNQPPQCCECYHKSGSPPKIWGIVLTCCFDRCSVIYSWERCKEGVTPFQEEDGDGKVPISALTRGAGPWPGGDRRSSAYSGSDLYPVLRTLSWLWNPLRRGPLSVSTNGS